MEGHAAVDQAAQGRFTPLSTAAQEGHIDIRCLVADGHAAVNQTEDNGSTPLLIALQKGHTDIARY